MLSVLSASVVTSDQLSDGFLRFLVPVCGPSDGKAEAQGDYGLEECVASHLSAPFAQPQRAELLLHLVQGVRDPVGARWRSAVRVALRSPPVRKNDLPPEMSLSVPQHQEFDEVLAEFPDVPCAEARFRTSWSCASEWWHSCESELWHLSKDCDKFVTFVTTP